MQNLLLKISTNTIGTILGVLYMALMLFFNLTIGSKPKESTFSSLPMDSLLHGACLGLANYRTPSAMFTQNA
jgi:hypothetical protein